MKTLIVLIIILVSVATTPLALRRVLVRRHYGTGDGDAVNALEKPAEPEQQDRANRQ